MAKVYIGIGSNLGNRIDNCKKAINIIKKRLYVINISPLYETEPWDKRAQRYFVNCVIETNTGIAARRLLAVLKGIESEMGRHSAGKWEARIIDLDILFYDDMIIKENGLIVPHPLLSRRTFVLKPLSDIAPFIIHPVLHKSVSEMLSEVKDDAAVKRIDTLSTKEKKMFQLDRTQG